MAASSSLRRVISFASEECGTVYPSKSRNLGKLQIGWIAGDLRLCIPAALLSLNALREAAQSNRNQATIAVARKLAAYLLAIDRGERAFVTHQVHSRVAA